MFWTDRHTTGRPVFEQSYGNFLIDRRQNQFYHQQIAREGIYRARYEEFSVKLLIAIPVYNEQKYVQGVLAKVRQYHDQILCVDDHSTDQTPEILAQQSGIHVIRHPKNMGYGRSIIDSFDFAYDNSYDWIVTMDCDEQHEPEMIPAFIEEIKKSKYDIISGTRYTDQNLKDDLAPGDRRLINKILTGTVNGVFGWKLTDTFCGFKAHRVPAMQKLHLDEAGYAFPMQLWPRAYEAGLRIKELPVKRIYNDPNRTFGGNLDDARVRLRHYLDVFKQELVRMNHGCADSLDQVTLDQHQPVARVSECCECCCG